MSIVYLSPHLDDTVLSCGGTIRRQVAQGKTVLVITLVTEDVAPDASLSAYARRLSGRWGGHPRPFSLRRAEDLAAVTLLGAQARHMDYLDAIYRTGADGQWMYTDSNLLFGQVHPDDPLAADDGQQITGRLAVLLASTAPSEECERICAPLAVGRHVDHQITHAVGRTLLGRGYPVVFYEDYPYARTLGATDVALACAGAEGWRMEALPLEVSDLEAKVQALSYYRSQLPILFGGAEAMIGQVWAFAASRAPAAGLAERIWLPRAERGENQAPEAGGE
jgi:LmbE family N-acetylglucosaminyl deacetylase